MVDLIHTKVHVKTVMRDKKRMRVRMRPLSLRYDVRFVREFSVDVDVIWAFDERVFRLIGPIVVIKFMFMFCFFVFLIHYAKFPIAPVLLYCWHVPTFFFFLADSKRFLLLVKARVFFLMALVRKS